MTGLGAVAAAAIVPAHALACSLDAPPLYAVSSISPGPGATDVPRDAGIIVTSTPTTPTDYYYPESAAITLVDVETGELVPGRDMQWGSRQSTTAWRPDEPLLPGRTYRIETASIHNPDGSYADGSETISQTFVTGDTFVEPLSFTGQLEISLEAYDAPDIVQCQAAAICGPSGGCATIGTRPALRARIDLPATVGGQADGGTYRARLYYTSDTTPDIPALDEAPGEEGFAIQTLRPLVPEAGEQLVHLEDILPKAFDFAPCFTYVVWDPAGHEIEAQKCLPVLSAEDIRELASAGADGTAIDLDSDIVAADSDLDADAVGSGSALDPSDTTSSDAGSGCAFGPTPGTPGAVLVGLAALFGGLARRRAGKTRSRRRTLG